VAHNKTRPQLRLTVSAVLAYFRIPPRLLAELNLGSCIELEPEDTAPILTFEVQGYTVARGYAKERDGMLSATIFWTGCQLSDRRFDQWTLKRELVAGDASDDRDENKKAE